MQWRKKRTKKQEHEAEIAQVSGRFLSETEFRTKAQGFVAIYEQASGRMRLYLREHGALRDERGCIYPDRMLNWHAYGRSWRAYAATPIAACPAGRKAASLKY